MKANTKMNISVRKIEKGYIENFKKDYKENINYMLSGFGYCLESDIAKNRDSIQKIAENLQSQIAEVLPGAFSEISKSTIESLIGQKKNIEILKNELFELQMNKANKNVVETRYIDLKVKNKQLEIEKATDKFTMEYITLVDNVTVSIELDKIYDSIQEQIAAERKALEEEIRTLNTKAAIASDLLRETYRIDDVLCGEVSKYLGVHLTGGEFSNMLTSAREGTSFLDLIVKID